MYYMIMRNVIDKEKEIWYNIHNIIPKGDVIMAAINCPECNGLVGHGVRKCPHCGFDICKAELAKYAEELSKTREERIKKNFETLKPKMDEEISYRESFYNKHKIEYAKKPSFIKQMFFTDGSQLIYIILTVLLISLIISIKTYSVLSVLICIAAFVGFGFAFLAVHADYTTELENYENFQCGKEEQEVAEYVKKIHEKYQREAEYETDREETRLIDEYDLPAVSAVPAFGLVLITLPLATELLYSSFLLTL